ncbi:hypothetical protein EI94DRAFT_1805270 [Lactarius quietus]|nr:hypothetical protein EI94DRAFT_1805270 [Lactarius quietus]
MEASLLVSLLGLSVMKSIIFLAAIAAPLFALAEPGGSALAEVVHRLRGQNLLARSGIDTSSVSTECQSQCSPIINTLDACNSVAKCECTQANFDSLEICLNCLQALSSQTSVSSGFDANSYTEAFEGLCKDSGYVLNYTAITAIPTGIASTGDPVSVFEPATVIAGVTQPVTFDDFPLLPTGASSAGAQTTSSATVTQTTSSGKTGGAVGLGALQNLNVGVFGAFAAVGIFMGVLPL